MALDNLSPEIYMKKKSHTETNLNPIKFKIKQLEEKIQKQNDYDYKRIIKELRIKENNTKKKEEKQKILLEEQKKREEKLKYMEEYRENLMKEKIKKILNKEKIINNRLKKIRIRTENSSLDINNKNECNLPPINASAARIEEIRRS